MNRPSKSQLLEYLLDKRVNSTLVQVVEAVLIEQPEEPISFMVQHLLDAYPNETASVRASFLAEEAEVEAKVKTEQSVTTRSRSNSSSTCSDTSSGSDLVLSISSGSTHTPDGGGGGEVFTATSPDSVEELRVEDKMEEGDPDKYDEEASSGGNTIAMTIEPMSSEEQEEEKQEEEKEKEKEKETNADKLDVVSASPMDISATSEGDDGDEDDIDNNDDIEDSTTAVPRRRTSIAAESIDLSKLRSSIKVVPKTEEESERILQILKQNVLFRHMDDEQLKTVQGAMTLVEKKENDTIIQQGDDGDYFYIIDNGGVDVYLKTSTGSTCGDGHEANTDDDDDNEQQQLVASYGEGDSFGELAIMYNAPRAASCIARTDVRLWALDRISSKIVAMQTACARRDEHKGFLASVPILSSLSEYEVLTLADALEEQSFEDGAIICKEGDDGDRFFLIKDGHVVCSKENPTDGTQIVVAQLGKGDYFGEVALLTEKKRQATVQASGDLKCLSVDRMAFGRCIGPLESVLRRNLDQYSSLQELLDKGIV